MKKILSLVAAFVILGCGAVYALYAERADEELDTIGGVGKTTKDQPGPTGNDVVSDGGQGREVGEDGGQGFGNGGMGTPVKSDGGVGRTPGDVMR